jgi:hypothetical protein
MIGDKRSRLVAATTALILGGAFGVAFLMGRSSAPGDVALADPDPGAPPPSVTATITLEEPTSRPPPPFGGVGQDNPPGPDVMPDPNATPDITQSWWYIPYRNFDNRQPVENLTLNGISVGPDVKRDSDECDAETRGVFAEEAIEAIAGSRVDIPLTAFPDDAIVRVEDTIVVLCGGEPMTAEVRASFPQGSSASRFGGWLLVFRWHGEPQERMYIPAYRWSEGTLAGLPVAMAAPILPELGYGNSAVLIFDGSVATKIQASGIRLEHLLAIAMEIAE